MNLQYNTTTILELNIVLFVLHYICHNRTAFSRATQRPNLKFLSPFRSIEWIISQIDTSLSCLHKDPNRGWF